MADTPTVGRIVHFINGKNEQVEHAAIITKVLGSDIVNLWVFPAAYVHERNIGFVGGVPLNPEPETGKSSWHWPERN